MLITAWLESPSQVLEGDQSALSASVTVYTPGATSVKVTWPPAAGILKDACPGILLVKFHPPTGPKAVSGNMCLIIVIVEEQQLTESLVIAVQPFWSVTVTKYLPWHRPLMSCVVEPLLQW